MKKVDEDKEEKSITRKRTSIKKRRKKRDMNPSKKRKNGILTGKCLPIELRVIRKEELVAARAHNKLGQRKPVNVRHGVLIKLLKKCRLCMRVRVRVRVCASVHAYV